MVFGRRARAVRVALAAIALALAVAPSEHAKAADPRPPVCPPPSSRPAACQLGRDLTPRETVQACPGPRVTGTDMRDLAHSRRRSEADAATRVQTLAAAHCALARRLARDLREEARLRATWTTQGPSPVALDEVRARLFEPSAKMNPCVRGDGAAFFAVDRGEFEGGLDVVTSQTTTRVFKWNLQMLARTTAGVVAIGGLGHMGISRGYLGEVQVLGKPKIASLACLPGAPKAAVVDTDGTLIVAVARGLSGEDGGVTGDPHELLVALDDDGSLYDLDCDRGSGKRLSTSWATSKSEGSCEGVVYARDLEAAPARASSTDAIFARPEGGPLTSEQIECVVAGYKGAVADACRRYATSTAPPVGAKVTLSVNGSGVVVQTSAVGAFAPLNECLEASVKRWQFPKSGAFTTFVVPFTFARRIEDAGAP